MSLRSCLLFMLAFQLACIGAEAQTPFHYEKHDQPWVFSGGSFSTGQGWVVGEHIFIHDSLETGRLNYSLRQYSIVKNLACMGDSSGNLLFFSNGWDIFNHNFSYMHNGTNLAPGSDTGVTEFTPREIALPVPNGGDSLYALFYNDIETPTYPPLNQHADNKLYYAIINARANNGSGDVIEKNHLIATDTFDMGFVSACRHANGRDWWIFVPKRTPGFYCRYLLRPDKLDTLPPQYLPQNVSLGNYGKLGLSLFSPDGSKYARVWLAYPDSHNAHLELYDVDRCNGLFYNGSHSIIPIVETSFIGGIDWYLAFSPSGRFLYLFDGFRILQYDLRAPDLMASQYLVASYPVPTDTTSRYCYTMLYKLGSDGVIYGSTTIINQQAANYRGVYLSKILNPDLKGDSCHFHLYARQLPWTALWTFSYPNTASYRAGPVDGSACDTLGIDMWNIPWTAQIKTPDAVALPFQSIYPNPASAMVSFIYSLPASPYAQWQLYNSTGQPVAQRTVSGTNGRIELDTATLPPGLYVSVFITAGGQRIAEKLVVGR